MRLVPEELATGKGNGLSLWGCMELFLSGGWELGRSTAGGEDGANFAASWEFARKPEQLPDTSCAKFCVIMLFIDLLQRSLAPSVHVCMHSEGGIFVGCTIQPCGCDVSVK
jgi:hypothetical protein